MKILLVDDHALFRAGLRLLLSTIEPDADILEAGTVAEALGLAQDHEGIPLCLLDLQLQGEYGLDSLRSLKDTSPEMAVVVVSSATDGATIRSCLDAGAMGFIPKSLGPGAMTEAIRHVLAGQSYLPEVLLASAALQTPPPLTPRQRDVLSGLCRGLPAKSIARELQLSEYTVKEYTSSLFVVLGVRNRTEAAIVATRLGLAPGLGPRAAR